MKDLKIGGVVIVNLPIFDRISAVDTLGVFTILVMRSLEEESI